MKPFCFCKGRKDIRCDDTHCDIAGPGSPGNANECRVCWRYHQRRRESEQFAGKLADTRINQGAGGIGDALLGLCAVAGYKAENPSRLIDYAVSNLARPFVSLFDGGYELLSGHRHDGTRDESPGPGLQLNLGYNAECRAKCAMLRLTRYCRNIGVKEPRLPALRDLAGLTVAGADFAGCVVLAPGCTHGTRTYPLESWQAVEKLLLQAGYSVVVLDDQRQRAALFQTPHKIISADAATIAAVLLSAHAFAGNDSGLTHLSAIMGQQTLVLCGPTSGAAIFDFYPRMSYLNGPMDCQGCWWQAPYNSRLCEPRCPALAALAPETVAAELMRLAGAAVAISSGARVRPPAAPKPRVNKGHCQHLGEPTGEKRDCEVCGGAKDIPLMACAIHGRCAEKKLVYKEEGQRIEVPWCLTCKQHVA